LSVIYQLLTTSGNFRLFQGVASSRSGRSARKRVDFEYGEVMPSPIGHAIGGLMIGFLTRRPPGTPGTLGTLGTLALSACLPDLDFLWGRHNMETHSVGAAALAGLVALVVTRGREPRLSIGVALAWGSHVLFDWLGSDDTPPLGVMALWPFSEQYYFANAFVFEAISRRYHQDGFWAHNLWALTREVLLLGPPMFAGWWLWRRRVERNGRARGGLRAPE
jgi:hypothetical protein